MVGVLAPNIGDIQGVVGGANIDTDVSTGRLLGNIGDIFGAIGSSRREQASQTDRDRALLQPWAEEADELYQMRQNGVPQSEIEIRGRRSLNKAIKALPEKIDLLKNIYGTAIGSEIATIAPDLETESYKTLISEATDFSDPENAAVSLNAYSASIDSNGQLDEDLFLSTYIEKRAELEQERAKLSRVKRQTELLKQRNEFTEEAQNLMVDDHVAKTQKKASEIVSSYLKLAGNGQLALPEGMDVHSLITALTTERNALLSTAKSEALDAGFLDNIEQKYDAKAAEMVAPLDLLIETLGTWREEGLERWKSYEAADKLKFGALTESILRGIPGGTTPEMREFVIQHILQGALADYQIQLQPNNLGKHLAAAEAVTKGIKMVDPVAAEAESSVLLSPEGEARAKGLSDSEARDLVRGNLDAWDSWGALPETDDAANEYAVNAFTTALETMNVRGVPIKEELFDRIYSPRFFEQYNEIQALGGPMATQLENTVANHLASTIATRKGVLRDNLRSSAPEYPSVRLVENVDNTYSIAFTNKIGTTEEERVLFSELDKRGLPKTHEGIKQLSELTRRGSQPGDYKIYRDTLPLLRVMDENIRYLNKTVATAKMVSDNVTNRIFGGEESTTEAQPVTDEIAEEEPVSVSEYENRNERGIRNNNPLNMRVGPPWQGRKTEDQKTDKQKKETAFEVFETPQLGIRAAVKNLQTYSKRGLDTVEEIINRWSPPSENITSVYINKVAKDMGVDPKEEIDVSNRNTLLAMVKSMIEHENGVQPYPDELILEGIDLAIS